MIDPNATSGPSWIDAALCARSAHPEWWFPTDSKSATTMTAIEVCSRCQVQADCLDYAITNGINRGIWGGQSASARRRIARQRLSTGRS